GLDNNARPNNEEIVIGDVDNQTLVHTEELSLVIIDNANGTSLVGHKVDNEMPKPGILTVMI
ncbi:hypothetical protein A2U01_0118232, partial [Trifolium medium]|nr:hypothetical protein [Trifolium medium]